MLAHSKMSWARGFSPQPVGGTICPNQVNCSLFMIDKRICFYGGHVKTG